MLDLKTCLRAEFTKAYTKLQADNKDLKQRLKQYESEQSDDDKEKDFQKFLTMYGKKTNQKQAKALWFRLSKKKISKIWENLPGYVKETPDKNFRVTPDKYLRHEKFDDVFETVQELNRPKAGARALYEAPKETHSTVDYSSMIAKMKTAKPIGEEK